MPMAPILMDSCEGPLQKVVPKKSSTDKKTAVERKAAPEKKAPVEKKASAEKKAPVKKAAAPERKTPVTEVRCCCGTALANKEELKRFLPSEI